MRRINPKSTDKRTLVCPQCNKLRMTREIGHEISLEKQTYTTKDKTEIDLYVDICDKCQARNFRKYFEPSKEDIRGVLKSIKEDVDLDEDKSLEDML